MIVDEFLLDVSLGLKQFHVKINYLACERKAKYVKLTNNLSFSPKLNHYGLDQGDSP